MPSVMARHRSLGVTLAVLLFAALLLGQSSVALAQALPPPGYPYSPATYGQTDQWWFIQGQCTSWVAYKLNTANGVAFRNTWRQPAGHRWSDAALWAAAAKRAGVAVNDTPARGAVAWFASGHVGYVEQVNADGTIVMSDMNRDYKSSWKQSRLLPGGWWPSGFIHVADLRSSPGPDPATERAEDTTEPAENTAQHKQTTTDPGHAVGLEAIMRLVAGWFDQLLRSLRAA